MLKFIVKCIVVFLAIQFTTNYLRNQEIIEGSIKINYQTIQKKLLAAIPTDNIVNAIVEFTANKIQDAIANDDKPGFPVGHVQQRKENPRFKIVDHVVDDGETLNDLSQKYGVHWRVIQKVNHLDTGHKLFVGQKLRIPSKIHNLI